MRTIGTRAAVLTAMLLAGCVRSPEHLALSGPAMGSTYSVKVIEPPRGLDAHALRTVIDATLADIDVRMSGYRADSEVARFNAAPTTQWVSVSPELAEVASLALQVSADSDGAFDVTVAPLVAAWGFGPSESPPAQPDEATVAALRERVGYRKLHARRDAPALRKDVASLAVDLNGIAPGYAVDQLAQRLHAMGVVNYMIEIGGEVRVRGHSERGGPWRVAVERPFEAQRHPYAILELSDLAVATSGEYRRFHVIEGERISHTIDPRTGRPVHHELASVVVVGPQAAQVDAWATAYNVLGADRGFELASRLGMAVMFIERSGDSLSHRATPRFEPYIASDYLSASR